MEKDIQEKVCKALKSSECVFFDLSSLVICVIDESFNIIGKSKKFSSFFGHHSINLDNSFFGKDGDNIIKRLIEQFEKKINTISLVFTKRLNHEFRHILLISDLVKVDENFYRFCVFQDLSNIYQQNEKLKYLSFHDELTGLYNRNYFENEIKKYSDGRMDPIGVFVFDVDGMKLINDSLGHHAGDKALQGIAKILRKAFRKSDIVCRVGGDEFAILIPHANINLMENLIQRIKSVYLDLKDRISVPLYFSMGYSVGNAREEEFESIFKRADISMYSNKFSKRNESYEKILKSIQ
ncbi:diguanylate cyclase [Thermodesulfobium narugense DSM 14796]|uniref:diguanylate cyclase n=1 Tax=Thermodesulfobium narugense DSM 14796 TaxID=747365 RepID=M1E8Z3_9BACT|nr:GGDEF domain-containing protein [Thermodesulfobium narugense]AEE14749.1 diguanylate cyclase [Thermodesulfobium narugense DSM 14796]